MPQKGKKIDKEPNLLQKRNKCFIQSPARNIWTAFTDEDLENAIKQLKKGGIYGKIYALHCTGEKQEEKCKKN